MKKTKYPFFVWILAILVGTIALLSIVSLARVEGVDWSDTSNMRWLLTGQDIFLFILPALWVAFKAGDNAWEYLHVNKCANIGTFAVAVALMFVAMPGINLLSHWNEQLSLPSFLQPLEAWMQRLEETNAHTTDALLDVTSFGALLANIVVIGLLAALSEELTFRGVLLRMFTRRNTHHSIPHGAIWGVAILFSLIHFQFYGFIPRMLMGALFGYALAWTGNLWVPIVMHFVNNATAVIVTYVFTLTGQDTEALEAFGTGDTQWAGIVSLALAVAMIYLLRRSTTMSKASSRTSTGN